MDVTAAMKTEIRELGLTLPEFLERYDGRYSVWHLRKVYADARLEEEQQEMMASDAFSLPVFEPRSLSKKAVEAIQTGWLRPLQVKAEPLAPARPLFDKVGEQYLVISDVHAPDDDPHAMDVMFQIGRSLRLDGIIINGDLDDVASLSRYTPNAEQHLRWVDERVQAHKTRVKIRQNFPNVPIMVIPGNHDIRPKTWIDAHAMPLQNLFTLEQLLGWDDPFLEFDVVHEGRVLLAEDNLMVKHGIKIGPHAGASVKKEIDTHGMSVIMGHVHRRADIEVTKTAHTLRGIELGCLCNLRPHYLPVEETANWQHGFAVVNVFDNGEFEPELVRIYNGKALFRGKRFVSRV